MAIRDRELLADCIAGSKLDLLSGVSCKHPLDQEVVGRLSSLQQAIRNGDDDYEIFRHRADIDILWKILLEKAIICLRYYDKREPFLGNPDKTPRAYGIDNLKQYYDKYTDFERILYGTSEYYRDHVIHVFRTWLSGIVHMTENNGKYLEEISIHEDQGVHLEYVEKISIWTLIALTHDLGYPLQKAKNIIEQTRKMVSTFITNPDISIDFSFHGVQNYMNDFILRLMSSKMVKTDQKESESYVARLQSKYYFKFQKSLERNDHGILSVLIVYKLLTYFLESDYSLNEDYHFTGEDRRQFYIRREILRAITTHTCNDIYQMYIASFPLLLRICDDTQEWGRKNISELYVSSSRQYELNSVELRCSPERKSLCAIHERVVFPLKSGKTGADQIDTGSVKNQIDQFRRQAADYIMIFRDGQDTIKRDFSFMRELEIDCSSIKVILTLKIPNNSSSELRGTIQYSPVKNKNDQMGISFWNEIKYLKLESLTGRDGLEAQEDDASTWGKRFFTIDLVG